MKKLIKKAIGCFVIFSFAISNIAQAAPPESALRPGSSRETPLPHELEGALSNPIEYDNIAPGARSILDELGPSDKAYFANLFSQFMNPAESRPLIIGGNFFPSAMLSDEEFEQKLGAAQYEDLLKDKRNTEAAKNVTLVHNPLNGGIGQAMKRLEFLRQIWDRTGRKGEVDWGAKSMDCYFKVSIIINGQEKEAFVSVAEATILALLHETELGLYKRAILQEFISGETRKAMKDLMDTDYLYDRVDDTKKQKRKYGDILRERGFLADFPEQALFPRFCVQDNNQLTDRQTAPGSHGQWGVYTLMQALDEELPEDGSTLIHTIYNGDGISNSPDNVITGWMARERIPIIMISTTRTGIDKKGGMIGIDYIDEERTALRKNLLELADAENNDKTHPGQTALFRDMGLTEGRKGQQLFNTNTVLTNTSVLKPLLIELKDILGIEELTRIIGPKLIKKSKRVTDDDDTEREYIQLEGPLGSVMLNFADFLLNTTNKRVKAALRRHNIDPKNFLRIVNIDIDRRTDFFAPIKYPVDYWIQFYSDHFKVNTERWKLINLRPGHVPAIDIPSEGYYSNVLNLLASFENVSTLNSDAFKIRGNVKLANAILKGNVEIISRYKNEEKQDVFDLNEAPELDSLKDTNGRLTLHNISIVIDETGTVIFDMVGPTVAAVLEELKQRQPLSMRELFSLVKLKVPESMQNLHSALRDLEPLSQQEGIAAGAISEAISQTQVKHSLSDTETRILRLAILGRSQGKGPVDDVSALISQTIQEAQSIVDAFVSKDVATLQEQDADKITQRIRGLSTKFSALMQEAEPKTVTESTEAQKKIRDFLWAAETAERAASLSKNIDWRLEKLAEEGAKIDITSPILLNDEELPPDQRADIINSIKKNRAELIKRFGVNLILKSEYEKDPGAYDTSRMIVLSRTIIKGAENARYLDITTISGEDAFLNIANVLTIAKGFLCCVVTQHPDLKVRLINFLRRNGIQAAEGELEDLLERFIAEPGFMLKLQLPSPKPVTRGYFNELHRLMSQVFIAA